MHIQELGQGVLNMEAAWQRFRAATLMLARSGTVKDRLHAAYRTQLADLDENQLPADLRKEFAALRRALTREAPLRGEDALTATIRKLSSNDADAMAVKLVEIFADFSRNQDAESGRTAPVTNASQSARVIPLFALEARP